MSNRPKPASEPVDPDAACPHCGHEWGPHVFAAADQLGGMGIWWCPEEGCPCKGTWDAPQLNN